MADRLTLIDAPTARTGPLDGSERMAIVPGLTERRWRPGHALEPSTAPTKRRDLVKDLCGPEVTPHIAQNEEGRRSATQHSGYRRSQRRHKRVEEVFGWIKTIGAGRKLRDLGPARNKLWFELTAASHNLTRLANIETVGAWPNLGDSSSDPHSVPRIARFALPDRPTLRVQHPICRQTNAVPASAMRRSAAY